MGKKWELTSLIFFDILEKYDHHLQTQEKEKEKDAWF